jgi:signal transduction histidine kinase
MTYLFSELKLARERRRNLESIFFHDIYNVIGGIRGAAELLPNSDPAYKQELCRIIVEASDQAADEIEIQKTMAAMENHELQVNPSPINSKTLLEQVVECYRHHKAGQDRTIAVGSTSQEVLFESDQALLSRVLGNMIKNALEATALGGTVTVGCAQVRGGIEFWVHNPGVVPEKSRKRIFHRSVSAKGPGRGMGTYSMRVLSEQLRGKVSFTSLEGEGTTFRAWYPLKFQYP